MREISSPAIYFEKPGPENTSRTLALAEKRALDLNIHSIIVASTTGDTGSKASEIFKRQKLVVVTHSQGFKEPNTQELTEDNRLKITANGGKILTAQHTMGGLNRAIRLKLNTYQPDEIIADVLRMFGAGMKVMMEITMMAADAGLINAGEPAIAIAGTHSGADWSALILPVNSFKFFDLRILEIICMPAEAHPGFRQINSH